jgi:MIP family channel proteins
LEVQRQVDRPGGASGVVIAAPGRHDGDQEKRCCTQEGAHEGRSLWLIRQEPRRSHVQDRGPAAYLAEFIGTLLLVFFITAVVSLFVTQSAPENPNPFIDWSVIGLVHAFVLFALIQALAVVSGAHFNPAVTIAMVALRQVRPSDAGVYIVAQLAGAVAGALLTKWLLTDFPNADAVNFGAVSISDRLDGKLSLGMLGEFMGTFFLVFTIIGAALDPRVDRAVSPWAIGAALALGVMIMGSLTGAGLNPARAFGPDLVSGEWDGFGRFLLAYVLAPILGGLVAAVVYFRIFLARGPKGLEGMEPVG